MFVMVEVKGGVMLAPPWGIEISSMPSYGILRTNSPGDWLNCERDSVPLVDDVGFAERLTPTFCDLGSLRP